MHRTRRTDRSPNKGYKPTFRRTQRGRTAILTPRKQMKKEYHFNNGIITVDTMNGAATFTDADGKTKSMEVSIARGEITAEQWAKVKDRVVRHF